MGGISPGILEAAIALCDLNGWGVLCLGMCYCFFLIFSRALKGVSNKHSRWDRIFLGSKLSIDKGARGIVPQCKEMQSSYQSAIFNPSFLVIVTTNND